jgi:hypothetical protein
VSWRTAHGTGTGGGGGDAADRAAEEADRGLEGRAGATTAADAAGQATPEVVSHDNTQRQRHSDDTRDGRRGLTLVARGEQPSGSPRTSPMTTGLRPSISMVAPGGGSHWQGPCPCTPYPAAPTTRRATAHKDATRGLHPQPPRGRHGGSITLAETGKNSCRAPARIVDAGHPPAKDPLEELKQTAIDLDLTALAEALPELLEHAEKGNWSYTAVHNVPQGNGRAQGTLPDPQPETLPPGRRRGARGLRLRRPPQPPGTRRQGTPRLPLRRGAQSASASPASVRPGSPRPSPTPPVWPATPCCAWSPPR